MDIKSHRTAVVISKVEQVFMIVSHVGCTRYESHDEFTGNQTLKDVIHAETVLPGSYRRGLYVRFEIMADGWFHFLSFFVRHHTSSVYPLHAKSEGGIHNLYV